MHNCIAYDNTPCSRGKTKVILNYAASPLPIPIPPTGLYCIMLQAPSNCLYRPRVFTVLCCKTAPNAYTAHWSLLYYAARPLHMPLPPTGLYYAESQLHMVISPTGHCCIMLEASSICLHRQRSLLYYSSCPYTSPLHMTIPAHSICLYRPL